MAKMLLLTNKFAFSPSTKQSSLGIYVQIRQFFELVLRKQRDIKTNLSNSYFEDFILLTFNWMAIFKIFLAKSFYKSQVQFIKITSQPMSKQHKDVTFIQSGILPRARQTFTVTQFQILKTYSDPTSLMLGVDLMIKKSTKTSTGAVSFAWFCLVQFNLGYLCSKNLEENVDLHLLHLNLTSKKFTNTSSGFFIVYQMSLLYSFFLP